MRASGADDYESAVEQRVPARPSRRKRGGPSLTRRVLLPVDIRTPHGAKPVALLGGIADLCLAPPLRERHRRPADRVRP